MAAGSTTMTKSHRQRNLRAVLRQAEQTLETAIQEIDVDRPHDLLDALVASRRLVLTAREQLDRTAGVDRPTDIG